ncbi:hypothetical protein QQ020_23510 [Fulvivirgaceae bacterium BMA12]|uniref:Uncharacterized protein n=1 Tax=Agaribacillus aureus TaxID=3051825 RepID=A0ABT8LBB8_9BACT|nr:hypothetical protein [Fulvivirgaceae bacterium BMA12]
MKKTNKRTDLIILIVAILLSTILVAGTAGFNNLINGDIDIALYDTYFVVPKFKILLLITSLAVYIIFLIRQILSGFNGNFGNYILVGAATILLLLTFSLEKLIWIFRILMNSGWHTELPEDGAMFGDDMTTEVIFLVIKVIIIATLLLTGFKLGMNRRQSGSNNR